MTVPPSLEFSAEREEAELAEYLGEGYDRGRLERSQDILAAELRETRDEHELYRTSRAYLYDLTRFAMSQTKLPYLEAMMRLVPPGARILDYGCGIGSDGLMLLEAGYRVEFADFANPSTEYLRWRLVRRSWDVPVHDLDAEVPGGFDAAYAFDVIEHVPDPVGFLEEMESRARLVVVNLLEYGPHEQELHHELPIGRLLLRTATRGLAEYHTYHGSSHLVLYRPGRVPPHRVALNFARLARGTVRARWR